MNCGYFVPLCEIVFYLNYSVFSIISIMCFNREVFSINNALCEYIYAREKLEDVRDKITKSISGMLRYKAPCRIKRQI